jgi:hypothetical protein
VHILQNNHLSIHLLNQMRYLVDNLRIIHHNNLLDHQPLPQVINHPTHQRKFL